MLMTKLKSEEVISSLASGKVFIINCHGCKEVGFPEEEAKALEKALLNSGSSSGRPRSSRASSRVSMSFIFMVYYHPFGAGERSPRSVLYYSSPRQAMQRKEEAFPG